MRLLPWEYRKTLQSSFCESASVCCSERCGAGKALVVNSSCESCTVKGGSDMAVCRLRSKEDIDALAGKIRLSDRPAAFRVELLCETSLSPKQRRALERRLALALSDCGCVLASAAVIAAIVVLYFVYGLPLAPIWPNLAIYLGVIIAAGGIAKLASLYVSYCVAHWIVDKIRASITAAGSAAGGLSAGAAGTGEL